MLDKLIESMMADIEGLTKEEKKGKRYIRNDYEGIAEKKRLDFVTTKGVPVFALRVEDEEDVAFRISFREDINDKYDYWFVRAEDCDDLIEYFTKMKEILITENQMKEGKGKLSS